MNLDNDERRELSATEISFPNYQLYLEALALSYQRNPDWISINWNFTNNGLPMQSTFKYTAPYNSMAYYFYRSKFFESQCLMGFCQITKIDVIENPYLFLSYYRRGNFLAELNGSVVEKYGFYATTENFVKKISKKNISMSRGILEENGAVLTKYASDCLPDCDSFRGNGVVIYCRILISNVYTLGHRNPMYEDTDTIWNSNERYIMKFRSDEIYPLCAIYYTTTGPIV